MLARCWSPWPVKRARLLRHRVVLAPSAQRQAIAARQSARIVQGRELLTEGLRNPGSIGKAQGDLHKSCHAMTEGRSFSLAGFA